MADETQNVVLDFKMNGQVQFANTVKDINAVICFHICLLLNSAQR